MARQVQIIKGTTEQNDAFTGAEGVLTYDTETKNLRIHDGTTEGGFEIPSSAMGDYVIYWDSADSADHSHAKPGVSTPTNHGWYRYYKSGWVEQGGRSKTTTNASGVTVDFSIPVSASSFVGFSIIGSWNDSPIIYHVRILSQATDNMDVVGVQHLGSSTNYQVVNFNWQTCGYAA